MAIVYVTDGDWGVGTGAPLPASVIDNNFFELFTAIQDAVSSIPQPAEISNIEIIGSQMRIFLSNGESFGPYTLPVATFQFRGDYVGGTHYYELDIFTVPNSGLYMTRIEHDTVPGAFNPSATDGDGHPLYLQLFAIQPQIYDVGFFYPGLPGNGLDSDGYVCAHLFLRNVFLPAGLENSKARLRVAPDADLTFPMARVDDTGAIDEVIGNVFFAAGEKGGVFTLAADAQFAAGETLILQVPTLIDVAAKDLTMTINGTLGSAT